MGVRAAGAAGEAADVYPGEVGAFQWGDGALGEVLGEDAAQVGGVAMEVGEELLKPGFALGVGGDGGGDAEGVEVTDFVDVEGSVDSLAYAGIGGR